MKKNKLQIIGLSLFLIFFFVIGIIRGILNPYAQKNAIEEAKKISEGAQSRTSTSTISNTNEYIYENTQTSVSSLEDLSSVQTPKLYPANEKPQITSNEEVLFESDIYQVTYYPQARLHSIVILKNPYETYKNEALSKIDDLIGRSGEDLCGLTIQIGAPRYVNYDASINPTTVNVCNR